MSLKAKSVYPKRFQPLKTDNYGYIDVILYNQNIMRRITLIFISIVLVHYLNAQSETCKVLLDKISGTYNGECLNGLANGKGKSTGEDIYIGSFKNGLPDGKGKYILKNGDIYKGFWKEGKKNGKGKFEYTLNEKKYTLTGYWKKDEYVGITDPDISYRVITASGIFDYKIEKNEPINNNNIITFSIKSAFTDFAPRDLKIENSSGQIIQSGKKFTISQYFCPLHCEISYTILVGGNRKHCYFIIEIIEEGNYNITLSND